MPGHAASWGRAYPSLVSRCEGGPTLLSPVGQWPPTWAGARGEGGDEALHSVQQPGARPLAGQASPKREQRRRSASLSPHALKPLNYSTYDGARKWGKRMEEYGRRERGEEGEKRMGEERGG